ncbi:MAG: histidine kinase N-terminal 7TM domain-containing protein, partial [Chloroflexota bacterium]
MFQFHPYAAVLAVSALTALATSIIILRRDVPGSTLLGGVLLSIFVWSGAYAMSWSLVGLPEKILWLKIMYLGTATIPGLFLVFILRITHNDDRLNPRNLLLLALEPFIIIVLTWFDLRLMFNKIELDLSSG